MAHLPASSRAHNVLQDDPILAASVEIFLGVSMNPSTETQCLWISWEFFELTMPWAPLTLDTLDTSSAQLGVCRDGVFVSQPPKPE